MKKLVFLVFIGFVLVSCSSPSGGEGGNSNGIVIDGYNLGAADLWVQLPSDAITVIAFAHCGTDNKFKWNTT